ncbi:MAG: hypothetical protein K6A68_10330 [Clostridiales bacterium]|nr:hypothetical protein [Clostridiales bacterium]
MCTFFIPHFCCNDPEITKAYQLAVDDLQSNIHLFKDGLLTEEKPVIIAGNGYDTPWTRDTAINVWNGAGLLVPEVAKNTLLSVLAKRPGSEQTIIGGQYWDAIIWAVGAWSYYLYTGDREFIKFAEQVILHSLEYFEDTEFDVHRGLFRGPACYGDGVAAYPDRYFTYGSGILSFPVYAKDRCAEKGVGIPMFALSTNCLYYAAYQIAFRLTGMEVYAQKADALKAAINTTFWDEKAGTYSYLADPWGGCASQESMGLSFALMFGIASPRMAASILDHVVITPNGIPCVYPSFARYLPYGLGRHSGTVWPHIQAFWAHAAGHLNPSFLETELRTLTRNALREGYFSEIYHPETGLPYGGAQEGGDRITTDWVSQKRQTWSATGYLHMLLFDLAGLSFHEDHLSVQPVPVPGIDEIHLDHLVWRDMEISLDLHLSESSAPIQHTLPYKPMASVHLKL